LFVGVAGNFILQNTGMFWSGYLTGGSLDMVKEKGTTNLF